MILFKIAADNRAATTPRRYRIFNTSPCNPKPKKVSLGITNDIKTTYIGRRAAQVIKGVTNIVSKRSFVFSMLRAAMMAGTAQPTPDMSGIRSEEHTSELQSRENIVCRLLLEKKNSNLSYRIRTKH